MEEAFRLRFLGPVEVERAGEPVRGFRSRKALALLGYLAVQGRPVPREHLAELFWEGQSESRGRANLSWALNRIAALVPDILQADRHTVGFQRTGACWLDTDAFRALEAQGDAASLAAAADLYRGEFLEGLYLDRCAEFELWLVGERERWRERAARVLGKLVTHCGRRGEHEQGLRVAQRLLALEPWREEAHRQVMRLLARSGQRSAALAQYEACRRVLAQELGAEPTAETTALAERIRVMDAARRPALPVQPTPFVGREVELAELADLLNDPDCRLLTVTGPGGIGKTRLALQAAARTSVFLEGVCFVPLAGVGAASVLVPALADALRFPLSSPQDPRTQLLSYLRDKEVLLVLDGYEHLLPETSLLGEILQQAPGVKLLITSRERLRLRWEWCFALEGLGYPNAPREGGRLALSEAEGMKDEEGSSDRSFFALHLSSFGEYDAVRLFQQTARRVSRRFDLSAQGTAVARVCRLVEGMPLAIELAAAWAGTHTVDEIADEIEGNLGFLSTTLRDVPARHRSMPAAFEHSWQRLAPAEQQAFMALSVFRGGFSPEAAVEVADAAPAVLESLADRSLLRVLSPGRYETHELLRQYAAARLADWPEVQAETHDRHCAYYATFLQRRETDLIGPDAAEVRTAVRVEMGNVHAAWDWAVAHARVDEIAQALDSLSCFYALAGPFQEGERLVGQAVDRVRALVKEPGEPSSGLQILLARLLVEEARFLNGQGRYDPAIAVAREAIDRAASLGEAGPAVGSQAAGYLQWGEVLWRQGDLEGAQVQLERSLALARAASLRLVEAAALRNLGGVAAKLGDYAGARACQEEALRLSRAIGDRPGESRALGNLGNVALYQADYAQAQVYYEQVLAIQRETDDRWSEASALVNLAISALYQGDYAGATTYYDQVLRLSREIGDWRLEGHVLVGLGCAYREQDRYTQAQTTLGEALRIGRETGNQVLAVMALDSLGSTFTNQGDYGSARACYEESLGVVRETGDRRGEGFARSGLCLLAHCQGDDAAAYEHGQQALRIAETLGEQILLGYVLSRLGCALEGLGRLAEAADAYRQALDIRQTQGQQNQAVETLAGLARVALARGDLAQAQAHVEEVLRHLETHGLEGADEAFRVRLTCYQILCAVQDPHAPAVLDTAHRLLRERAARIGDEELRRSFLENVPAHREILHAWQDR